MWKSVQGSGSGVLRGPDGFWFDFTKTISTSVICNTSGTSVSLRLMQQRWDCSYLRPEGLHCKRECEGHGEKLWGGL